MPTTILQLVQDFTAKRNLPTPTALVGSQEKSITQYLSLLRETVADLSEYSWQQQNIRRVWTSLAGQEQGTLESIFGAGYSELVQGSMWNNTRRMRVYGPLSEQIWQALQILPNAGPEFQMWVAGNHLYVSPAFNAGESLSAIYRTIYGVVDSGGTAKSRITADSDSILFPDNVTLRCFEYKWRKVKADPGWEDDYNDYMALLARATIKDGATTLTMASDWNRGPMPGIVIPAGSWHV